MTATRCYVASRVLELNVAPCNVGFSRRVRLVKPSSFDLSRSSRVATKVGPGSAVTESRPCVTAVVLAAVTAGVVASGTAAVMAAVVAAETSVVEAVAAAVTAVVAAVAAAVVAAVDVDVDADVDADVVGGCATRSRPSLREEAAVDPNISSSRRSVNTSVSF